MELRTRRRGVGRGDPGWAGGPSLFRVNSWTRNNLDEIRRRWPIRDEPLAHTKSQKNKYRTVITSVTSTYTLGAQKKTLCKMILLKNRQNMYEQNINTKQFRRFSTACRNELIIGLFTGSTIMHTLWNCLESLKLLWTFLELLELLVKNLETVLPALNTKTPSSNYKTCHFITVKIITSNIPSAVKK